jgi:hypothetical protein
MEKTWIQPRIIIGAAATGDFYYHRPEIEENIWLEINKGSHILIAAPRRVGKTSLLKYLENNPRIGFKVIFKSVQGIDSASDYFSVIYNLILTCLSQSNRYKNQLSKYLKSKKITEINLKGGIKFEDANFDYLKEIKSIISDLDQKGEVIVLLIDELPEVLHTLHKSGKNDVALQILRNIRNWRQDDIFNKLKFVYSGSIGMHYITKSISGRTSDLNDLADVKFPPFSYDEAKKYIEWATCDATIKYDTNLSEYLLSKIQFYIPYFINLMLGKIDINAFKKEKPVIDIYDIDAAFIEIIKENKNFDDWAQRLSDYLTDKEYSFVNKTLTYIAHNENITIQKIYDFATQFEFANKYMQFINDLENDGYIVENDNKFTFISPYLKEYWRRNNPIIL